MGIAAWRPIVTGVWHDDGVYMLIGKALADGAGYVYGGVAGTPPAAKFPPLFPLWLAALWSMFGGIGAVTMAASFLNLALLAVAGALFAKVLHEAAGLPLRVALVAAAMGFAATDVLRTGLVVLSEPLFLALMSVALLLWARLRGGQSSAGAGGPTPEGGRGHDEGPPTEGGGGESSVGSARPAALIGALSGVLLLIVATRSAGIALVTRGDSERPKRPLPARAREAALLTAPALLFTWGWGRWAAAAAQQIPEPARDLLGPYSGWLADQSLAAPLVFLAELPSHAAGVGGRALAILLPGLTGVLLWAAAALLLPALLVGVGTLRRRFPPLAWYAVGYLAMLLLWPYLDRRLLVPLHPGVVAAIFVGAHELLRRAAQPRVRAALLGVGALWIGAFAIVTASRIADGWPTAPYRLRAERLAASVEALSRTAPPDAIVGAPEFWAALHLHGGWTVAPSVRFDPRSVDPEAPMWGTPDEQIALWRAVGIDHLLLEQNGQLHAAALDQIEAACPGTVFVLARLPGSLVVRIDWAKCPTDTSRSG